MNKSANVGLFFPGKKNCILTLTNCISKDINYWHNDKEYLTNKIIKLNTSNINPEFSFIKTPKCLVKDCEFISEKSVVAKPGMELVLHAPFGSIYKATVINNRTPEEHNLTSLLPIHIDKQLSTSAVAFNINNQLVGFYIPEKGLICISLLIQLYNEYVNNINYFLNSSLLIKDSYPRFNSYCKEIIAKGALIITELYGFKKNDIVVELDNQEVTNTRQFILIFRQICLKKKFFSARVWYNNNIIIRTIHFNK